MHQPIITHPWNGGIQKLYRFSNNRGASVVKHEFSYGTSSGLWELAVIKYIGEGNDFRLDYSTSITDDVLGNLTDSEVESTLNLIEKLP